MTLCSGMGRGAKYPPATCQEYFCFPLSHPSSNGCVQLLAHDCGCSALLRENYSTECTWSRFLLDASVGFSPHSGFYLVESPGSAPAPTLLGKGRTDKGSMRALGRETHQFKSCLKQVFSVTCPSPSATSCLSFPCAVLTLVSTRPGSTETPCGGFQGRVCWQSHRVPPHAMKSDLGAKEPQDP